MNTSLQQSRGSSDIGVSLPRDCPIGDFVEFARLAEDSGFDQLWVVEDCFYRGGFTQAATVLAATSKIQVGIGILPAAMRNPVTAALEAAFLAELHPGRITLGLGHGVRGWMEQIGAWPSSPLTLLAEQLSALRGLLHGETLTTEGTYVNLHDVTLEYAPQIPPLVFAGVRGPKSLQLSGRIADGTVLAEPSAPEYIEAARAEIGVGGEHRIVAYNVAAVHQDRAVAREAVRHTLAGLADPGGAAHIASLDIADDIRALRRSVSSAAEFTAQIPDEWIDRLTLCGTAEDVTARIGTMHDAGADTIVLIPPVGADALSSLRSWAPLVRPS